MDFDKYQKLSRKTAIYPQKGKNFIYPTLGLADEAGEVTGKIKKAIRDDGGKITKGRRIEISKELGDVLWYIAQLSTELKLSLSDIAKENLKKLKSRMVRGTLHGSGDNR
jgi:NTP pyrophosphatase (non-canonical NTP hydrolase)